VHSAQRNYRKGLIITALGGLVLTFDIPLIRLAEGQAWSILLVRTVTTLAATVVIWFVWRLLGNDVPRLVPGRLGLLVAALYGLTSVAFILGVYNTSTADLVFILAFNPMFSAVLSWIFLKERPQPATLLAMAVMIVGVLIIVGDAIGHGTLFGDLMALASAFLIAAAITLSRSSREDMGFTSLVGVVFPFIVAAVMVGKTGYSIDRPWWIVFDGAVVMPLSFFCLASGPRYISGGEVAMFYLLETVLAPVWVWAIFAEVPSRNSLIGGAILIAALLAHSIWQLRHARRRKIAGPVHYPA
jgi:drug/metabolite transporter (DMT)-like permease